MKQGPSWDVETAAALLAEGRTQKDVATQLGITPATLSAYRARHPEQFEIPHTHTHTPETLPPAQPDITAVELSALDLALDALEALERAVMEAARQTKIALALLRAEKEVAP